MCNQDGSEFTGVLPCNSTFQSLCDLLPAPLRLGSASLRHVSRPSRKRVGAAWNFVSLACSSWLQPPLAQKTPVQL